KHLAETLRRAAAHRGTAFVQIYQNCIIFNQHAWDHVTDVETRDDSTLVLEHGKPMIFGKKRDRGILLNGLKPEVVTLAENGITESDLLVHDEFATDPTLAYLLSRMEPPHFPVPLGVFRQVEKPTYADLMLGQGRKAVETRGPGDLSAIFRAADTWTVSTED